MNKSLALIAIAAAATLGAPVFAQQLYINNGLDGTCATVTDSGTPFQGGQSVPGCAAAATNQVNINSGALTVGGANVGTGITGGSGYGLTVVSNGAYINGPTQLIGATNIQGSANIAGPTTINGGTSITGTLQQSTGASGGNILSNAVRGQFGYVQVPSFMFSGVSATAGVAQMGNIDLLTSDVINGVVANADGTNTVVGNTTFNNNVVVTGTTQTAGIDNTGAGITNAGLISGVTDGVAPQDAVNVRQLNAAASSQAAAIANQQFQINGLQTQTNQNRRIASTG
ncbi:MAG: hypothetical protein EOO54_26545, partial [Haliea sp.]